MKRLLPRPTYANVVATVALFVAFGGSAYAVSKVAPVNSVDSKSIVNDSIQSKDVKDGSLTGADIDQSTLNGGGGSGGPPSGPAGGDLAGNYPKPQIAPGAVGTGAMQDKAVTASKLDDQAVTSAKLGKTVTVTKDQDLPAGEQRTDSVICPSGTTLLTGGGRVDPLTQDVALLSSFPVGNGWFTDGTNDQTDPRDDETLTVWAVCLQ